MPPPIRDFEGQPRGENDFDRQRRISSAFETMRKWNLRFSGAHGEDPVEFLKSINEGRGLLRIEDQELLQCIPFLMTGVARNWYRSNNWA